MTTETLGKAVRLSRQIEYLERGIDRDVSRMFKAAVESIQNITATWYENDEELESRVTELIVWRMKWRESKLQGLKDELEAL